MDDSPTMLENRQQTGNHWVAFRLERAGKNRFCIGARLLLDAGGRRQVREVRSGGSYLSQSDLLAHFGLGRYGGPLDLEVRMPGGARWRWKELRSDRVNVLVLKDAESLRE
jgi:enediyne biosynthesis protein E4